MGAATRRLKKELASMNDSPIKDIFKMDEVGEDSLTLWSGLLYPSSPPYDKGAFRIDINFGAEYPFKPPKISFKTPIYHPNVDDKGQICFPLIAPENWKPATKMSDVLVVLHALVGAPEIEHPLRADLAEEYQKDRAGFFKKAADQTAQYAEKR